MGLPGSAFCYSFKEWTTCHYALPLDNGDSPGLVTSLIKAFGLLIRLTARERESEKGEGVSACYGLFRKTVPAYTSGSSASIHHWKQCQRSIHHWKQCQHTPVETVPADNSGKSSSIQQWKQCRHTPVETVLAYTIGNSASIQQWKQCRYTPGADTSARIPQVETVPAYPRWRQCQHTPGGNSASLPQVETVPAYPRWKLCQPTPRGNSGTLPHVDIIRASNEGAS